MKNEGPQVILGIETSCDETACAVLKKDQGGIHILSNVVASSAKLQAKYGGVIPEQAAREQIKSIIPVIQEAIIQSNLYHPSSRNYLPSSTIYRPAIDAIAVTYGPGLIGSLLVGVETAKTLATVWDKPLIPVNHLIGHFYANWIATGVSEKTDTLKHRHTETPGFPCIGLLVSGGHTDLLIFKNHGKYEYLGGTRDDAAGECFDKCARLLGLPYPGGPAIAKLASQGEALRFYLPRPMIDSGGFDFSFSGLKTAVANLIHTFEVEKSNYTSKVKCNLAAAIEQAIVDVLVKKSIQAVEKYGVKSLIVAGGVASNQKLTSDLKFKIQNSKFKIKLHVPPPELCTDNAAMIAAAAFFNYQPIDSFSLQANPSLGLI